MNPFFFGTSAEPLFGVFHPAKASTARNVGVLLCCPVGQEYMRSHRAFRQMALLLGRAGCPVLRFDYFGTGDSAGDSDQFSLARCPADVEAAAEELKDMTGVTSVGLVGLRMGATIAALSAERVAGLSHVVLWDPVIDGSRHLVALLNESRALAGTIRDGDDVRRVSGTVGSLGFPLTPKLREEVAACDLATVRPAPGVDYLIVASTQEQEYRDFYARFRTHSPGARLVSIPIDGNWNEVDEYGSALIPQAAIRYIVDHLSGATT